MSTDIPVKVTPQGIFRADYLEEMKKDHERHLEETREQRKRDSYSDAQMTARLERELAIDSKLDSEQTNFTARSLIYTLQQLKTFARREAADILESAVPINREGGPGIRTINYQELDLNGQFKAISNVATDLPEVGSTLTETGQRVQVYGASMGWSQIDLENAAAASRNGRPVDIGARKRMAVMRAAVKKKNDILFQGDPQHGLKGFFDYELNNVSITGGWNAATSDQILADLLYFAQAAETDTEDFQSNTMILDSESYAKLISPRDATDTSVAQYIMNNTTIRSILKTSRLNSVTSAVNSLNNERVMIAYPNTPEVMEFAIPRDVQFMPVQGPHNLMYYVPVLMDIAGLLMYKYGADGPVTIATGM